MQGVFQGCVAQRRHRAGQLSTEWCLADALFEATTCPLSIDVGHKPRRVQARGRGQQTRGAKQVKTKALIVGLMATSLGKR